MSRRDRSATLSDAALGIMGDHHLEYIRAAIDYKARRRVSTLTTVEHLELALSLGYRKVEAPDPGRLWRGGR